MFFFFSFYFVNLTDVSDILTELFLYFFRFFLSLANSNYTTDLRSPFEYRFIYDKRGFKSQERETYYWSSDGVGRFVTWFILWITCQNVPVDRWELVAGVVSFSMPSSETSFTLKIIMTGLSNSFFANITLSFTLLHLKMRSHHCWLDYLFWTSYSGRNVTYTQRCTMVLISQVPRRSFWFTPLSAQVWERAG